MQRIHRYSFDKISANARQHLSTLSPLRNAVIEGVSIVQAGIIAHNWGYQARISFEQPYKTRALLEVDAHLIPKEYDLSYIEIADEIIINDPNEAEKFVIEKANELHLARGRSFLFDSKKKELSDDPKKIQKLLADINKKGLWSDYCLYLAPKGKPFNFVIYASNSKIDKRIVVKSEFRIRGKNRIYKEIGCSNLADIARLDIKQAFLSLSAKHLQRRQINYAAVGRLLAGKHHARGEQAEQAGSLFCRMHKIRTPSDLDRLLKDSRLKLHHAERLWR